MKTSPITETGIQDLIRDIEDKKIILDVYCQRTNNQWTSEQKSLFIHSILAGYPIPPLYFYDKDEIKYLFDGLQRITAILDFVNDNLKLHKETPEFQYSDIIQGEKISGIIELAGKRYSDIMIDETNKSIMKSSFDRRKLSYFCFYECSEDEQSEIFKRLNNGTTMSNAQRNLASLDRKNAITIKEISNLPLFKENSSLTSLQKKKDEVYNLVLQLAMLLNNYPCSKFTAKELGIVSRKLRRGDIQLDMKLCKDACEKLSNSFLAETGKIKNLNKYQIMIFAYHTKTVSELNIPLEMYGEWIVDFLSKYPLLTEYRNTKNIASKNVFTEKLKYVEQELRRYKEELRRG